MTGYDETFQRGFWLLLQQISKFTASNKFPITKHKVFKFGKEHKIFLSTHYFRDVMFLMFPTCKTNVLLK